MSSKSLVLDANILIRAVLGTRVRVLIFDNASNVQFFAPDVAYADARKYLPPLLEKRGADAAAAMDVLGIGIHCSPARYRLVRRDEATIPAANRQPRCR